MAVTTNSQARPLVVDLDGTLLKTDLLIENMSHIIKQNVLHVFWLCFWLLKGRAYFKMRCAEHSAWLTPETLPYHMPLVSWLKQQKDLGRTLVLATGSHTTLAQPVAAHLGLFNQVMATEGQTNLVAHHKKAALQQQFAATGYDYIGNSMQDMPVWRAANCAYVVSSSQKLIKRVKRLGNLEATFSCEKAFRLKAFFKLLRPHQWVKNLLLFIPALTAHLLLGFNLDTLHLGAVLSMAFMVFSLTASSVYILNDVSDVSDDRHHHKKKHRPFASGDLSLVTGWFLWPCLLFLALALAYILLPLKFLGVLSGYFLLTFAYSHGLKQKAIVDVLTLAALYTLRLIAGACAVNVPLSFWLLAFSMFFFLSLAFIKRFSELQFARHQKVNKALRGRGYMPQKDLEIVSSMGVAAGYLAVLVLALYIQDTHTAVLYRTPQLIWLACPLLLGWISRAWLIAHRGKMHHDPVVFALKDKASWGIGVLVILIFYLAKYMG